MKKMKEKITLGLSVLIYIFVTSANAGDLTYCNNSKLRYINGNISNPQIKDSELCILALSKQKVSKSSRTARAKKKNIDINDARNYEKKWQLDNSEIKDVFSVSENTPEASLIITYYDENIFPSDQGFINSEIENSDFKILSLFRNNILAFDKTKKKYFPILVESCMHGCNKNIEFIDSSTLQITYSEANNEKIIVDLKQMTYKITVE